MLKRMTDAKSLFTKFIESRGTTSMICEKLPNSDKYECRLGFDCEANLLKTNKFEPKESYSKQELENFLQKDLGAQNTHDGINRWVIMDNKHNSKIYSFGGDEEVHVVKQRFMGIWLS